MLDELLAGDWDILSWPNFLIFSRDKTKGFFNPEASPQVDWSRVCEDKSSIFTLLIERDEDERLLDRDETDDYIDCDLFDL